MVLDKYKQTTKRFDFEIPETHLFCSLEDLYNQNGKENIYQLRALYINTKSKYGDSPVLVLNNLLVNAPNHLTDTAKAMIADGELVDAVNNGEIGFKIYTYTTKKYKGTFYGIEWVEIDN